MISLQSPDVREIALTPVVHLVLYKLGDESILLFLRQREAYERVMLNRKDAGSTTKPIMLKASTYPKLLTALTKPREVGEATVERLICEAAKKCLKRHLKIEGEYTCSKNLAAAVRKEVKCDTSTTNKKLRIMQFFVDIRDFMDEKCWKHRIGKRPKACAEFSC